MTAEVITFHKMLNGCIHQESKHWEFFLSTYGSLARNLIERHFADLKHSLPEMTLEIFRSIAENGGQFLKEFSGSSEREFLIYFEGRVFSVARSHSREEKLPGGSDIEFLGKLFDKMPLVHQEVGWVAMKGIRPEETSKILRVPLALVQAAEAEVLRQWTKIQAREISSFARLEDSVRQQVENQEGTNCPAIKTFADMLDGRIVWREKQQLENHVSECIHCLDRETMLRETLYYLRTIDPLPRAAVQNLLMDLKLDLKPSLAKPSLLSQVMKVFK